MLAVARHEQRVAGAEQADAACRRGVLEGGLVGGEQVAALDLDDLVLDGLEQLLRVRGRDAGPRGEVVVGRGPEMVQVAAHELGLRGLRVGRLELRPLVGAGVGRPAALVAGHAQPAGESGDGQQPAAGVVALTRRAPRQQLGRQPPAQLLVQRVAAEHTAVERRADRADGLVAGGLEVARGGAQEDRLERALVGRLQRRQVDRDVRRGQDRERGPRIGHRHELAIGERAVEVAGVGAAGADRGQRRARR